MFYLCKLNAIWQQAPRAQCVTYKLPAVKCGVHLQFTDQDLQNICMSPTACKDERITAILQRYIKDRETGGGESQREEGREGRNGSGGDGMGVEGMGGMEK